MKENKAKFFAQYYGQKVLRWHQWAETTENGIVHMITPMASGICSVDDGWYLQLKLISQISDEDAIECAKMFEWMHPSDNPELWNHPITKEKVVKTSNSFKYGICTISFRNLQPIQADYLRSKGYALPFLGMSVEEMEKLGWIKLIN